MEKILREPEVLKATSFGRTKLWQEVREGRFPKPRLVGKRGKGWLSSEIDEHLRNLPVAPEFRANPDLEKNIEAAYQELLKADNTEASHKAMRKLTALKQEQLGIASGLCR